MSQTPGYDGWARGRASGCSIITFYIKMALEHLRMRPAWETLFLVEKVEERWTWKMKLSPAERNGVGGPLAIPCYTDRSTLPSWAVNVKMGKLNSLSSIESGLSLKITQGLRNDLFKHLS